MGKPLFTFDERRRLETGRDRYFLEYFPARERVRNTMYVTAVTVDGQDGKSLMNCEGASDDELNALRIIFRFL